MARFFCLRTLLALGICLIAVIGLGALALASGGAEEDGVFTIELRDGEIAAEAAVLAPGRQVIEAVNAGTEEHEIVVVRTKRAADDIPVGLHGVSPSLAGEVVVGEDHAAYGHNHRPDVLLGLAAGTSKRFGVDLEPGRYVALCQTDNHYLEGEHTAFEVR